MKQKESVVHFNAIGTEQGLTGKDLEAFVVTEVFHGLQAGDIEHKNPAMKDDEKECKRYAKALVSNHYKKAKELNGGIKYVPATTRGPIIKDVMLKELTEVLKQIEGREGADQLVSDTRFLIETRKAELEALKPAKTSAKKVFTLEEIQASLAKYQIPAEG